MRYTFEGGQGGGAIVLLPTRSEPTGFAFGVADGRGEAVSDVAVDGGSGREPRCSDGVRQTSDGFVAVLKRRRGTVFLHTETQASGSMTLNGPGGSADYLDTRCAGPRDFDLAAGGATPSRTYATSRFRRRRFELVLADSRPFRGGGFIGTVRFRVRFSLTRATVQVFG